MLLPILGGAALGALFAVLAANRGAAGERRLLALGLVVAALIYVGLAMPSADSHWLAVEAIGVIMFGGLAWVGSRAAGWLALGWAAHVAWDVGLHLDRAQPVVGGWYPLACVGFDLVIAGFVLHAAVQAVRLRAGAPVK